MGTTYYVYVSPACGDFWEGTTVTTGIGLEVPYYNDFSNELIGAKASPNRGPKGWTLGYTAGTSWTTATYVPYVDNTTSSTSGWYNKPADVSVPFLKLYNGTTTSQVYPYAIMPELLSADVKDLQMAFYAYTSNTSTTSTYAAKANAYYNVLKIGVVDSPSDINKTDQFTKVTEIAVVRCEVGRATKFVKVDFSAYTGSGKYIVFYQDTLKTNTSFVDNLTIAKLTDPWKVSDLTVSEITQTSAKFTWTEMGSATKWEVRVFDSEQDDPATAEPVWSDANVTTPNVIVTGLAHSTQHFAYVRSLQASGNGEWNNVSFWTETGEWSLPFAENFDSYYATSSYKSIPNYYDLYQADGSALSSFTYFYVYNLNNEQFVKMQATSSTAYKVVTFAFPPFNKPINTLQVSFQAHADATTSSTESAINTAIQQSPTEIGVLEADGTFVPMGTFSVSSIEWEDKYFNFQNYTGAGGRIAIRCDYNKKNATNAIRMDNFHISEIPSCGRLLGVEISEIDSTTATLSWVRAKSETKWNLKVSTIALEDPDAATADVFDGQLDVQTKALSGLQGNTTYYVYIQTIDEANSCSGDWSSATLFRTSCVSQNLPYEENFNSYKLYGVGVIPDCSTLSGQDENHSYVTTRSSNDGTRMLYLRQVTKDHNNYFAFPALNVDSVKRLQLTMFVNPGGTTTTNFYYYEVGVMTDPTDPNTFVSVKLDSVQGAAATVFYEKKYTFENYHGDDFGTYGTYIALHPLHYKNPTNANANYYAGYVYIDDVTIDYIETCAKPTSLTSSSIGINDVTLTWATDDNMANHRVRIFANADANPDNDTFISEAVVAADTAKLSGLSGNTIYYAFVRKECGDTDGNSKWSLAYSFHTDCPEITSLPYVEGFEGCTVSATPNCWTSILLEGTSTSAKATTVANGSMNYAFESEKAMSVNYYCAQQGSSGTTKASAAAITPRLDVENLKDVLVYFDIKAGAANRNLKIEAVSDNTKDAEAIYITTIENIPTTWTKVYLKLGDYYQSAQPYQYLRFVPLLPTGVTSSSTFYIDNITFTTNLNEVLPITDLKPLKVTINSLTFSFSEKTPGIEHWQMAYVTKEGDIADAIVSDIDTTTVTIHGLTANSSYDIYVRSKVDGSAWVGPLTMTTSATIPAAIPYQSGFEDSEDNALWEMTNLTAANKPYPNKFIIGDADSCGATGSKALFVTGNDSDYHYNGSVSYAYASRSILIEDAGSYWISIKAKVPGNTRADQEGDYMCAHIVPAGSSFMASSIRLLDGTTRSYNSESDSKNCYWLANKVTHENSWKLFTRQLDITEPGEYDVVIVWTNNTTETPGLPVAIDSVSVTEYLCTNPSDFEFTERSAHSAAFKWFAGKCKNFEYVVSRYANLGNPNGINAEDKIASGTLNAGPQVAISGLLANTNYSLYIRTICEDGYTEWAEYDFETLCEAESLPYTEAFVEKPECWLFTNASVTTRTQNGGDEDEIWPCLQLNNGGIAILPELDVPINKVKIEIAAFNGQSYGAVSIGVIDDVWDVSTFVELANFAPVEKQLSSSDPFVLETRDKMFNLYTGSAKHIALRNISGNAIYIKYVKLTELPDCIQPYQVEITNITENAVTLNWIAGVEDKWEIKVDEEDPFEVTENPYRLTNLEQGTPYTVSIRAVCDAQHVSEWTLPVSFQTTCGTNLLPMDEDFSGLVAQDKRAAITCWDNFVTEGKIENVFNGKEQPFSPLTSIYYTNLWIANQYAWGGDAHQLFFFGYYGTSSAKYKYRWMITPQYAIEGNASLSFDLRCIDNKGTAAHPDGRFFVVISTDNGATWKKADATEIKEIDSVYTTKSVSLDKYVGQNIRVAFYMEDLGGTTTAGNGSGLFTLVDNVRMNCTDTYPIADNACQGVDYEGNGFAIAKEDLPLAGQDSTYYRFAKNDGNGCDSIVALTITTHTASALVTVYDTICEGQSYTYGGQTLTESNPDGQPYHLYGQTVYGCDSIIDLYLNVQKKDTITQEPLTVPQTVLPYVVDEYYTIPEGTALGQYEQIVPQGDGCIAYRYLITIVDRGTGLINITDGVDRVEVYDALGRKVQTLTNQSGVVQLDLPVGMYMIRTTMLSGDTMSNKIVIK